MEAVLIAFAALFLLLFLQVPIALGMGIVGTVGFAYYIDIEPALGASGIPLSIPSWCTTFRSCRYSF